MELFSNPLSATAELVLVINETSNGYNNTSLFGGWISGSIPPRWEASTGWICAGHNGKKWTRYCSLDWAQSFDHNWNFSLEWAKSFQNEWGGAALPNDSTVYVDHCQVGARADDLSFRCGFHYNFNLLLLIIVLTAIDTGLICSVAAAHDEDTLVIFGDAVAKALEIYGHDGNGQSEQSSEQEQDSSSAVALVVGRWPDYGCPRWSSAVQRSAWIYSIGL